MEFELKKYYTIEARLFNGFDDSQDFVFDKSIHLNILLNDGSCFSPNLFKIIGTLPNSFMLSLYSKNLSDEKLKLILPKLFILSCLNPSLFADQNTITIAIINNSLQNEDAINTAQISNYFNGQGNYNIFFPTFNIDKTNNGIQIVGNNILMFDNTPLPLNLSMELNFSTNIIIHFFEKINSVKDFAKKIDEISLKMLPKIISPQSLEDYFINKKLVDLEINLWKQRVELYQSFLVLSKTVQEKEYYDVLNWYHKEYEALPTWYKRVGHLIKVVLGKRSFKSLFTKTTKI